MPRWYSQLFRCIHNMKYYFINRLIHLTNCSNINNHHYLRSICIKMGFNYCKSWVMKSMSSTISHIWRIHICQFKKAKKGVNWTLYYWFQANIKAIMSFSTNEILVKFYLMLSKSNYSENHIYLHGVSSPIGLSRCNITYYKRIVILSWSHTDNCLFNAL